MSNARNLAKLIVDANGDIGTASLDNVPPSNDASALTTGTIPIERIADTSVTAAKLHTTAVTDKLGYTPANKAGDVFTGTLDSVGSHVQKVVTGGEQSYANGGSPIKRIEEMINWFQPRNSTRYIKVRVKQRYASDAQGCALTVTFGKFSEHASLAHWRTYKIAGGSGQGGDPAGWNMVWWTEKETAAGWGYYGTTFGFEIFYPNGGSVRDYFYIRLTNADNQGSIQSGHSFLHIDGFVGFSDLPLIVDMGDSQPSDWSNFASLGNSGTW